MSDVPEVQMESALRVDQCVGTCDPMFSQADVVALLDSKVLEFQDKIQLLTDNLEQCRANLLRVTQSRDLLDLQVKELEDKMSLDDSPSSVQVMKVPDKVRVLWSDSVPADERSSVVEPTLEEVPCKVVAVPGLSKKDKKLHRQSKVRAS
eukprot:TRINITY_DN21854_c0_g1_i1.p1 TRINITY_DN21854_c0_g1~~TRINITY_DN21854_c0_g1_i1.p1  ORF type:complete len:150 (-),score=34.97 TRINITY_DN21854_c0_g1_i1:76-525(-)